MYVCCCTGDLPVFVCDGDVPVLISSASTFVANDVPAKSESLIVVERVQVFDCCVESSSL